MMSLSKLQILSERCLYRVKRGIGAKQWCLSRREGKFSEREIEYAFLFNHLQLSPGHRLFEVGSGRSGLALVLAHCGYSVEAVDIKPEHPWIRKGDVTKLNFNDNSFDTVVSISVIEHVINSDRAILELLRVVIPSGLIILSFPYNPVKCIKDIYKEFKWSVNYICSIFNDEKIHSWFDKKAEIVAVEYWRQWSGNLWREGIRNLRAIKSSKDQAQGICLAIKKNS